jgi:hypothetical protein
MVYCDFDVWCGERWPLECRKQEPVYEAKSISEECESKEELRPACSSITFVPASSPHGAASQSPLLLRLPSRAELAQIGLNSQAIVLRKRNMVSAQVQRGAALRKARLGCADLFCVIFSFFSVRVRACGCINADNLPGMW